MTPRSGAVPAVPQLVSRTEAAIIATATRMLAQRPDVSMIDIAVEAGVGRATLYRYFPTREHLLDALHGAAAEELASRIEDAGLDRVPVAEGIQRLLRAVLTVADHYVIFLGMPEPSDSSDDGAIARVEAPVQALFARGIAEGTLRGELDVTMYVQFFAATVVAAVESGLPRRVGVEDAAALVTSLFLDGCREHASLSQRPSAAG